MDDFTVIIQTPSGAQTMVNDQLLLQPQRWSDQMPGGPRSAVVSVAGSEDALSELMRWLGYRLKILNGNNTVVWEGFISAVDVGIKNTTYSVDLMEMSNRVQVFYTYTGPDGSKVSDSTDWAEDVESVNKFGTRELRHSADDLTLEQAEALRDRILENASRPRTSMSFGNQTATSTLFGLGWYSTLDWTYYENATGRVENLQGGETQALGLGYTSMFMGWIHDSSVVYEHNGYFTNFQADSRFVITNVPSHGGTYTVNKTAQSEGQTEYVDDDIYFAPNDDITSPLGYMGDFIADAYLSVEGSPANSRFHLITSSAADHITTREGITGNIALEDAVPGRFITIRQGNTVGVVEAIGNYQGPGYLDDPAIVTAYGEQVAQSFYNTSPEAFDVYRIGVNIIRIGDPVDNVTVKLCENNAGAPGSVLATGTIDYTSIFTQMSWQWAVMDTAVSLQPDTAYFIVVQRLANNSPTNFYELDYSLGNLYEDGEMIVHTGQAWTVYPADADLSFQVQGAVDTSQQIADIVRLNGQFFDHTEIRDDAGFVTNQYREGKNTAGDEIEDLLNAGTLDSNDLTLTVTEGPTAILDRRSEPTSGDLNIKGDGTLFWNYGGMVEKGRLVAGHWLEAVDIPGGVDSFIITTPVYIAFSEYNVSTDKMTIRPTTAPDISDLEIVKQG